ncbi:MAG: ATP-NAD kinase family protein [Candidatus Freyarchaeota archaeon]
MKMIGFVVNPIAGMGGAVGLKGTDGEAYVEALKLGAKPVTPERAKQFLSNIKNKEKLFLLTGPEDMGENIVKNFDIRYSVVGSLSGEGTSAEDTKKIVEEMLRENIDLLVFVGGDGTARDIYDVVDLKTLVIGVPSGVKMFSSVFAVNPRAAAEVVDAFLEATVSIVEREVLDINEEAFRKSKLDVKLYGYLKVPTVEGLVQSSKEPTRSSESTKENQCAIAKYIVENMDKDVLYLIGPGTTTRAIADELKVKKTLLGVDAIYNGRLVGEDLNEKGILDLLEKFVKAKIIVSPIGGQGFIFGRGNQEFSPQVIKSIGKKNITIVATRDKISKLPCLRVSTGDPEVDDALKGYIKVVTNYNEEVMMKVD